MQQCGLCSMLSELVSRALCGGGRRGSTDSYYKELGDQDTLKMEDKTSDSEDSSTNSATPSLRRRSRAGEERRASAASAASAAATTAAATAAAAACTGRFLTMHKRRRKRLLTRSLRRETALLDDMHPVQTQCMLDQSVLWSFNAFALDNVSGGRSLPLLCVHLFQLYGLMGHFELDAARVWKLFSLIEEGYHGSNPYHNHVHAADVTQAMHCFLQQPPIREHLEPLEIMASLIGSIAHDVDHPGVNQPFLIATSNHLASLYQNTSVLENHHWRWAMSCLAESGLTAHLVDVRAQLEHQISSLILATDITRQQEFLARFKEYLDKKTMDMRRKEHRHFVLQIALKCADISNPCRPWRISREWSLRVCEEFFRQGDYERRLKLPVTALCDRRTNTIPKIQTGFFQFVVTPLVTQWHRFLGSGLSEQMLRNLRRNRAKWERLRDSVEGSAAAESAAAALELSDDETDASDSSGPLLPRRWSGPLAPPSPPPPPAAAPHRRLLSTEKLLPDPSIASITTPAQATRIVTARLLRQQTFPPLEATPNAHIKTDYLDSAKLKGRSILNKIMAKYELDKTVEEAGVERKWGRRESAPAGGQPALLAPDRRQSMPTAADIIQFGGGGAGGGGKEGVVLVWSRRRGSAPLCVSELRALVGGALRHSVNGGRRRLGPAPPAPPAPPAWLVRGAPLRERQMCGLRRRSSLPVEVLTGT